jgi:hypothetical protein
VHQRFVEISIKGEVDAALLADFEGVEVTADRGVTRLHLRVRDDSALFGLLGQVEGAGLEVLAVYPIQRPR